MNAIPLINNAPRPNINVGSIGSPTFNPVAAGAKLGGSIGGNVMRQNPASMPVNNETQLRQEINTSLVALKKEAGTLEGLINEAAQMLVTINNRIATLENDTVKKSDIVDVVQSDNLQPVTSNAVYNTLNQLIKKKLDIAIVTNNTYDLSFDYTDNLNNMNAFLIIGGNNGESCWLGLLTTYSGYFRCYQNFASSGLTVTQIEQGVMRFSYTGSGTIRMTIIQVF